MTGTRQAMTMAGKAQQIAFTGISFPSLSFRRKEESLPSTFGLEPWQTGESHFPCPMVRRLQTGRKSKQKF